MSHTFLVVHVFICTYVWTQACTHRQADTHTHTHIYIYIYILGENTESKGRLLISSCTIMWQMWSDSFCTQ